jgi:hypothetical protein
MEDKKHHNEDGAHKKGSHYDAELESEYHNKKSEANKGHYDVNDEGYKKKSGHAEKHLHRENHAEKGEKEKKSEHATESH